MVLHPSLLVPVGRFCDADSTFPDLVLVAYNGAASIFILEHVVRGAVMGFAQRKYCIVSIFSYMPKMGSLICLLINFINELYHLPIVIIGHTVTSLLGILTLPILSGSSVSLILIGVTSCGVSPPNMPWLFP